MKTTVSTIKVLFWVTAISVILTIPLSFYNVYFGNWVAQWTNAILVGVFASSLVVLISEYVRYKHMKSSIESDLYYNLSLLYLKLRTALSVIDKSYKEPRPQLTRTFLHPQTGEINNCNEKLRYDIGNYCTIRRNEVSREADAFIKQTLPVLINTHFALKEIEVAIIEDTLDVQNNNIESFEQYRCGHTEKYIEQPIHITATSSHTNIALQNVKSFINDELFDSLESFMITISKIPSNNFDWEKDKERIIALV
jgi:predicted nucleic-acid-binding Zn-ribbon protein